MKPLYTPITVIAHAADAHATQVTLTVRKGTAQADIQFQPRSKGEHNATAFAVVDGVLYSLVTNKYLYDFADQLGGNEFVAGFLETPLGMGFMPVHVKEKVRQSIVAVVARDTGCTCKLEREVLTVATLLASLRELWDAEKPGRGDAIVQTVARAAMGDLLDRKPQLALAIKNLMGWGNDDEQPEDLAKWLRKTVKKQLRETAVALRRMRDNPFGAASPMGGATPASAATGPTAV